MQPPEKRARANIDVMLKQCGWVVQDYKQLDLSAGRGVAVCEVPLKRGRCDYLLLVDRKPIGVVEAKKEGVTLSSVAFQSGFYATHLPDFLAKIAPGQLPFLYESTGIETFFRDERDPHPRSRQLFAFHRPETLAKWIEEPDTLRRRLGEMPFKHPYDGTGVRACRVEAINNLEKSFAEAKPRALIQMATGAGKTLTACAFSYRLIKHAGARNVLFLVDRANLGRQAHTEFQQFVLPDDGRKFTQVYNAQHLASNRLDSVARVTISTIQRLYSMLRGEELAEDLDERSGFELSAADNRIREVKYNSAVPIETFDFIIADECHRSIYNLWRQVLEYFDAFLIGLTATPGKQAIGFFNQNVVSEYPHERAVADGVNVGYDVYRIRTEVTEHGGKVEKGLYVDKRHKESRRVRWERLDDDLSYTAKDLDRSVVVKSQIRTVLQAFKDAIPELFPGRSLVPKTVIFTKDDSHAEDVVHICREVFGKGNDFCKKITYQSKHPDGRPANTDHLIQEFRLSPQLRIAVTVDMIATGTDVRPLECLVFLRDVRSRVYFEQMKGRGTRVLSPTELQAVSGAEALAKTHFVIVDAVGVCESDKTDSRPLDRKPQENLEKILLGVALGKRDEDTLTTLAARLARMDQALNDSEKQNIVSVTAGKTLAYMSRALLEAIDPDKIAEKATGKPGAEAQEVDPDLLSQTRHELITQACAPFDKPEVRDRLVRAKQQNEQTIDVTTIDVITSKRIDKQAKEKAEATVRSFRDYIEQHKAEIEALQILYSRPYKKRLTEESLRELEAKLKTNYGTHPVPKLWTAFSQIRNSKPAMRDSQARRFTDLISLVRTAIEPTTPLEPFEEHVRQNFDAWVEEKRSAGITFNADQLTWLEKMRDYISASGSVDREHLEADNVLGPIYKAFGENLWPLMDELNLTLAA